jgi:hypothetical protein
MPVNMPKVISYHTQSHHKSQFPLELVYSDVWGPASTFAGGYKYYVSSLIIIAILLGFIC